MVLQLDLPATPSTEPDQPALRVIGRSRPEEPAVPVYRHFLRGDPSEFRLEGPARTSLAVAAVVVVPGVSLLAGQIVSPAAAIGTALSTVLVCLPLAALVSRWAGRASGLLSGWVAIAGWTALCWFAAPPVMLATAAAIASILVYGLAELPHRTPAFSRGPAAVVFYLGATLSCILTGPALLAPIAAVCLGTLLGNGNSRGIRFFVSPVGLPILLIGVAIGVFMAEAVGPSPTFGPQWIAVVSLTVGLIGTWASVRSGHAASPLGRLLTSWLIAPPLVAVTGAVSVELATAFTLPAWAAMIGMASIALRRRWRRRQTLAA